LGHQQVQQEQVQVQQEQQRVVVILQAQLFLFVAVVFGLSGARLLFFARLLSLTEKD
tara:strand:- start:77 stop:247 length:171 start_codon:yes stop_codon:yes gene_type:complete